MNELKLECFLPAVRLNFKLLSVLFFHLTEYAPPLRHVLKIVVRPQARSFVYKFVVITAAIGSANQVVGVISISKPNHGVLAFMGGLLVVIWEFFAGFGRAGHQAQLDLLGFDELHFK